MAESSSRDISPPKSRHQQESRKRTPLIEQVSSSPVSGPEATFHPWESFVAGDFSQATFERHAALLDDSRAAIPMNAHRQAKFVQQLQRDYGNRYVQRLVDHNMRRPIGSAQRKLTVGPAGDKYEQEADRIAKQVVSGAGHGPLVESNITSQNAQRGSSGELEDEDVQLEPLDIQRQGLSPEEEEDLLQAKSVDGQRQVGLEGGFVEPEIESEISSARGRGRGLPDTLRESMESSFGADFGGVRLHSDANSDSLNQNLDSRAFTIGQDIFVRREDYDLTSAKGQELLAHELTHVVQQNGDSVRRDDDQTDQSDERKSGIRAAVGWGVEQAEKGVGWVSENVEKVGDAGKTWLQKKLSAGWEVLRKKFPWIATFIEGILGVVVNVTQLGWSGLKLIARIAWFILKSTAKSIDGNIGKVIDICWKFISGKTWGEVDLFGDTVAWFKDWEENKKNPLLWSEFLGVWTGNARDTAGWIALISGILALIPGPQSVVLGGISGVTGIITLILSAISPVLSTVSLFGHIIHYAHSWLDGNPVEEIEKRIGRLSVLAIGDLGSLAGALVGLTTEGISSEVVKQSTGAIVGGLTESTGDLATETVEEHATKGTPWSEIWEKIREKGETAWEELFKNLNRLVGLFQGVAKLVTVGFKAVGMVFGGLATVIGGIVDLVVAAKNKRQTGEWNVEWNKAGLIVEGIKNWNQWEKDKFFPGIWNMGNFVEDVTTWATSEKGNLFKRFDGAGKKFSEYRSEQKRKRES